MLNTSQLPAKATILDRQALLLLLLLTMAVLLQAPTAPARSCLVGHGKQCTKDTHHWYNRCSPSAGSKFFGSSLVDHAAGVLLLELLGAAVGCVDTSEVA